MGQVARLLQLKSLLQNQQFQQQQQPLQIQQEQQTLQEQQLALQSRKAIQKAYVEAQGDPDQTVKLAAQYGALPKDVLDMKSAFIKQQTEAADLVSKQGANAKVQADLVQGAHDAVDKAKPEERPQVYASQIAALQQQGVDVSKMPPQYPGDEQFKFIGAIVKGHGQQVEEALKAQQQQEAAAKAAEAQAAAEKSQQETAWFKTHGGAPGVSAELTQQADWLSKNPGKGPADYKRYIATLPINTRYSLESGGAPGTPGAPGGPTATPADVAKKFGLSQEAFDQTAEKYYATGQLPPSSRGISATAFNRAIMNRSADLHPGASLAANSAEFKANQASLTKLQGATDQLNAFESAAGKNLDLFLAQAKPVIDSGSPWINKPLRFVDQTVLGSDDLAAMNAARQVAINEIAKVTSNPGLTGQLSDTARKEVEAFVPASANFKQTVKVADILRQDMKNRRESNLEQIANIQARLKNPGAAPDANKQTEDPFAAFGGKSRQ
jgi:hypothetical protein